MVRNFATSIGHNFFPCEVRGMPGRQRATQAPSHILRLKIRYSYNPNSGWTWRITSWRDIAFHAARSRPSKTQAERRELATRPAQGPAAVAHRIYAFSSHVAMTMRSSLCIATINVFGIKSLLTRCSCPSFIRFRMP